MKMPSDFIKFYTYRNSAIFLTAIFAGLILYFATAPYFNDEPPAPKYFLYYRLVWFPICEIICLFCYGFVFRFLKFPSTEKPFQLLLTSFISFNLSLTIVFLGSDLYQMGFINFARFAESFDSVFIFIGLFNIFTTAFFLSVLFFEKAIEIVFSQKKSYK